MARFRKWNAAHNWSHPRGPGGKFRSKSGGGVARPRKRTRTAAQKRQRNAKIVRGVLIGAYAASGAIESRAGIGAIATGVSTGNPVLTAVGGARVATSVARQANEIHRTMALTRTGKHRLKGAKLARYEAGYERREKIIGRAHRVTGYAMVGTSVYGFHKAVQGAGGYKVAANTIRVRKAWNANAKARGIPQTATRLKGVKANRKGVYKIPTTAKKARR